MSDLSNLWRSAGVPDGGVFLLHSSAKRTLKMHGITPPELLDSFLEAVGDDGTLILPSFSFGFCHGEPMDVRHTKGITGILGETARQRPDAVFSAHPVYRFVILGRLAHQFRDATEPCTFRDATAYGHGSMWGWLRRHGGRIGVLDLPGQNALTAVHHAEETSGAHWRFHKQFSGDYTDENDITTHRTCSIYVRRPDIQTNVNPLDAALWQAGLYQGAPPHVQAGLRTIDANVFHDFTRNVIAAIQQGADHTFLYLKNEAA